MAITLARVDDRIIHGQTLTRWATIRKLDSILVVSDAVAGDEMRKRVLKMAAGSYKLGIYTIEQGIVALGKANASPKDFFVISDTIHSFAELRRGGADFGPVLNVGNLTQAKGDARPVESAFLLGAQDVEDCDYLEAHGVRMEFQVIPDERARSWADLKAKYESLA